MHFRPLSLRESALPWILYLSRLTIGRVGRRSRGLRQIEARARLLKHGPCLQQTELFFSLLKSCVTLGKLFDFSGPQRPHMYLWGFAYSPLLLSPQFSLLLALLPWPLTFHLSGSFFGLSSSPPTPYPTQHLVVRLCSVVELHVACRVLGSVPSTTVR